MCVSRSLIVVTLVATVALALLAGAGATSASAATPELTPIEQLGKALFFDQRLSINQNQSCAACHGPDAGWTGPDSAINAHGSVYEGSIAGRFGDRKPPASAYATQSPIFHLEMEGGEALFVGGNFWDGRATGEKLGNPAADQAQGPFLNPVEQALPDSACVVYWACNPGTAPTINPSAGYDYPVTFVDVWGAEACPVAWPDNTQEICSTEDAVVPLSDADRAKSNTAYDSIALSIAAYEASPESNAFTSKYDAYLQGLVKLTTVEKQGLAFFNGKGKCSACHTLEKNKHAPPALFTDYTFDNLGLPKNPENPATIADPTWSDPGLGGFLASRTDYAAYAEENMGKHKVPTLRNVAKGLDDGLIKAYGHNGYFKTLEGIVHFYNTRDVKPVCAENVTEADALAADCWPAPEVAENVNDAELGDLKLTPAQEAAIVAFLKTLSDGYIVDGAVAAGLVGEGEQQIFLPLLNTQ